MFSCQLVYIFTEVPREKNEEKTSLAKQSSKKKKSEETPQNLSQYVTSGSANTEQFQFHMGSSDYGLCKSFPI